MEHTMSCDYPEGCSCGASNVNRLEVQVLKLRDALKDIRDRTTDDTIRTMALNALKTQETRRF